MNEIQQAQTACKRDERKRSDEVASNACPLPSNPGQTVIPQWKVTQVVAHRSKQSTSCRGSIQAQPTEVQELAEKKPRNISRVLDVDSGPPPPIAEQTNLLALKEPQLNLEAARAGRARQGHLRWWLMKYGHWRIALSSRPVKLKKMDWLPFNSKGTGDL